MNSVKRHRAAIVVMNILIALLCIASIAGYFVAPLLSIRIKVDLSAEDLESMAGSALPPLSRAIPSVLPKRSSPKRRTNLQKLLRPSFASPSNRSQKRRSRKSSKKRRIRSSPTKHRKSSKNSSPRSPKRKKRPSSKKPIFPKAISKARRKRRSNSSTAAAQQYQKFRTSP